MSAYQQQQQWPRPLNEQEITYLRGQGYTTGMIAAFPKLAASTPLRIWIIDNGYLQDTRDASRITGTFENIQSIDNQSRWDETMDCVAYHSQIYTLYKLPTKFTLLNPPSPGTAGQQTCSVGEGNAAEEVRILKQTMTTAKAAGPSKLAEFINFCSNYISKIAPQLQPNQTISVILATQGRPTVDPGQDPNVVLQEFLKAIQSLASLPVFVVVRLTTNEESTFDFYNDLDKTPGLAFDVLDDYFGEALEIYLRNPWLCYGLPLHRMRESGFRIDVLDEIDERPLTHLELWQLGFLLFGGTNGAIPDPRVDWRGFVNAIALAMSREKSLWNPVKRQLTPWIDLALLNKMYGQGSVPLQARPTFPSMQSTPVGAYPTQQQTYQQPMGNIQQSYHHQQQQSYPSAPAPAPYPQQQAQQSFPSQTFAQTTAPPPPPQQRQQNHSYAQQSTTPGPSPAAPPPPMPAAGQKYGAESSKGSEDTSTLKRNILVQWALLPPSYSKLRSIEDLLSSVQNIFPPAFGVATHGYFQKWKPITPEALHDASAAPVLKRAIRKMKFFLHPDKLPKDLDVMQSFLCKMIWDIVADAEAAKE